MPSAIAKVPPSAAQGGTTSEQVALIACGDPLEKIAEILKQEDRSFAAFEDVQALIERPSDANPGLVVLWVDDTSSGLLGLIEPLTRSFAETPLIIVCPGIERRGVRAALMAGAVGVVLWKDLATAFGPCTQAVQAGQTCIPRAHWRQLEPPALSSREKQILGLVVMGYMNGQIAQQLFLAESTVKSHLSSAFRKLGVRSRNEAVNLILDPERGLGMGILALGGEPVGPALAAAR
ncbi:MAG: helix-turn-helix transcriptional regulator [Solirubrobacteraceae bacterium]